MKNCLFVPFICLSLFVHAQIEKPVSWSYKLSKSEVKKGEILTLIFNADIKKGWYMYSVGKFEQAPSTSFTFEKNNTYKLIGSITPTHDKKKVDPYIGEYRYFTEQAEFTQKVKILDQNPVIKGTYEYSTCSNETGVCLPPKEEDFSFTDIKVNGEIKEDKVAEKKVPTEKVIAANDQTKIIDTTPNDKDSTKSKIDSSLKNSNTTAEESNIPPTIKPASNAIETGSGFSLWNFFILAFASGLIALLTPCVFPMIPMTVTFFLKSGQSRAQGILKALVYGLSIVLIYTILGTLVAKLAGAEGPNSFSTHWIPNIFFFLVFILFALSFLGLFEITLPSWLVNASDRQADKGGWLGIFFMAFTLVLVSFSCTGPIVGVILVQSAGGEFLKPIVGMLGFSLAFAIPFTLFAIFPSWLQNLPKSGGWLNSVKVCMGFVELALAFKFLSLADQAHHWHLLNREVNIAIWIAIAAATTLYLFGLITLPHDTKTDRIGVLRLIFGLIAFSFTVYLVPGMFGAPLKPLSGYLPPLSTIDFNLQSTQSQGNSLGNQRNICGSPKYMDLLHLPHGLQGYFDYKEALACSKKLNKPVFIDFTGHGCVNCREMEANVWSHPSVLSMLTKDFIILALYVDDKTVLPESEWYTSKYDGRVKTSIGKQNADFQIEHFNNNAQPYYVIVDSNGNTLSGPKAYDLNVTHFLNFLNEGSSKYNSN